MLATLALRSAAAARPRILPSFSLAGRSAVLTGAAGGIGGAIARAYVESGVDKMAIFDFNADTARKTARAITAEYEHDKALVPPGTLDIQGYGVDVGDEQSVADKVAAAAAQLGQIDILLHSAGFIANFRAEDYPHDEYRRMMATNVDGAFYMSKHCARHVLARGHPASFILIASMSATIVNDPQRQSPYDFSKAAVKHMGAALGVEWADRRIRVNTISPGYVLSALSRGVLEKSPTGCQMRKDWLQKTPLGRLGEPEDINGLAVYLASDASSFMTAADVLIDGGFTKQG